MAKKLIQPSFKILKRYHLHTKIVIAISVLFVAIFFTVFGFTNQQEVNAASCSTFGINVSRISSPIFYIDTGVTPQLTNNYVGYAITNNTGSAYSDMWVKIEGFTGGYVSLATNEDGRLHVGPVGSGETIYAYFFLKATGETSTTQNHNIAIYDSRPDLTIGNDCSQTFGLTVEETIKANANKVNSVVSGPTPPELGGLVTMTVKGATGVNGTGQFAMTPSAFDTWEAEAYQLIDTSVTFTGGNNATYDDTLYITGMNPANSDYTITYTFIAVTVTVAPTTVGPVNYIGSGTQIKHTNTSDSSYQALPPIEPATNKTVISSKAVSPERLFTGGQATFSVSLHNGGSVEVFLDDIIDTLPTSPAGVTYVAGSSKYQGVTIPDPVVSGNKLEWVYYFPVAPGATTNLTYKIAFPNVEGDYLNSVIGHINGTQIDKSLDVSVDTPATASLFVGSLVDLSVTKSDSADPILYGGTLTYTMVVENNGPDDATNVTLIDNLPSEFSYSSSTSTQGSCSHSAGVVTCSLGSISNGSSANITITGNVDSGLPNSISNTVSVESTETDADLTNNSASQSTAVIIQTDVGITKTHSPDPVIAGNNLTYTITAGNNGPYDATNVTVTDNLDTNLSYVSSTATQGSCSHSAGVLTCNLGSITVGQSESITLITKVNPNSSASISNTASVSIDQQDNVPGNNNASSSAVVLKESDLAITKTDSPDPAIGGGSINYTITVTNNGPSNATGVSFTDTLPAGLTVTSKIASQGGCTQNGQSVTCNIGALGVLESANVNISADLGSSMHGTITNSVQVSGDQVDNVGSNNSVSQTTTVNTSSDLAVTKVDSPDPVIAGNNITYLVTVTNNGPSDAHQVLVEDVLPTQLSFVSAVPSQGTCSHSNGILSCELPELVAAETSTVSITAKVKNSTLAGDITNSVTVISSEDNDPDMSNNSASATSTVALQADLSLTKIDNLDPAIAGGPVVYTLQVSNLGPSSANGVQLIDTFPDQVLFDYANPSQGTCSYNNAQVTCDLGTIPNAGVVTVDIGVNTSQVAPAQITNTASVTTTDLDANLNNNTASQTTNLIRQADLSLSKSDANDPVLAGDMVIYSINVGNAGPSQATGVTITDSIPTGTTFVSANPSVGTCNFASGELICDLGDINRNTSVSVELKVQMDASVVGSIINSASAVGNETDPNLSNNSDSETTAIDTAADIQVMKVGNVDPVVAGSNLNYQIEVTNLGPSDAKSVQVVDSLPPQVEALNIIASQGTCGLAAESITCDLGTVVDGGVVVIDVQTHVLDSASGVLSNSVLVSTTTTDPDPLNNTDNVATSIVKFADLQITKIDSSDPVDAGQSFEYQLEIYNAGPSNAGSVVVSDPLPSGIVFESVTTTRGDCNYDQGLVSCNIGTMIPGQTESVVIIVSSDITQSGVYTNTATISSTETDPSESNNSATENTSIGAMTPQADIVVTKNVSHAKRNQGQNLQYTIRVENNGPNGASNLVFKDLWPDKGVKLVGSVPSVGSFNNLTYEWSINSLAVGQTETLVLEALTTSNYVGRVSNEFKLVELTEQDSNSGNDSKQVSFEILRPKSVPESKKIDLKIEKGAPVQVEGPEAELDYVIKVSNLSNVNANNIVITDVFPPEISSLGSFDFTSGFCEDRMISSRSLVCTANTIPAGEEIELNLRVKVSSGIQSTIQNIVSVTAAETDLNIDNNVAIAETLIIIRDVPVGDDIDPIVPASIVRQSRPTTQPVVIYGATAAAALGMGGLAVWSLFLLGFFHASNPAGVVIGSNALSTASKVRLAKKLGVKYYRIKDINLRPPQV